MKENSTNKACLERRKYGNTDVELSVLGFGAIIIVASEQEHANRVVAEAVECGVNYFDVAPMYGRAQGCEGDGEIKLGPALKPYRKNAFLACKTGCRDRARAEIEFNRSLERLQTDYFDLYQLHGISDVEKDLDVAFSKGGVMEMLIEKKRTGQIRHLGFSAHSTEAAVEAMERYDFDSALFAVNFACYHKNGYGREIIRKAQEKGVACLALKAMARQQWEDDDPRKGKSKCWYEPLTKREEASMALRWTLSQPIVAALPPGEEDLFQMAHDVALHSTSISAEEEQLLIEMSRTLNPIFG